MANSFEVKPAIHAPANAKSISKLLAELYSNETPWMPCGLGSRLHWGPPVQTPIQIVSVRKLNRIVEHSISDLTIRVEAGMPLAELQATLAEKKQWLAVDWPWGSEENSTPNSAGTVGGLIARGLSGSLRHRYLGIRDQIIGISMLRSDGITANAGGKVVKNVAGYDLMRLLCGSWGSLALITEVTFRTQPIRPYHSCLKIKGKLVNLEEFRAKLILSSYTPEYCDWVNKDSTSLHLEIGLASISKQAVTDQFNQLQSLATSHSLNVRECIWDGPQLNQLSLDNYPIKYHWLIRIVLPPAKVHHLLKSQEFQNLSQWEWRITACVGVGDGWQSTLENPEKYTPQEKIIALRRMVMKYGGQLIILNQPNLKKERLPAWLDAQSKSLIKAVKYQFDPKNQIAKGRLPGING